MVRGTCACTGGSFSHVDTVHRGDEALSNCPAPADTSEQSASKADPAIDGNSSESSDRNKESVAGFDLAKLCDIMSGSLSQSVMKRSCWVSLNIQNTFQSTRLAPSFQLQCLGCSGGYRNKAMGGAVILEGRHILERALLSPPSPHPHTHGPPTFTSHWVWNSGARHKLTFHASMHAIHNLIKCKYTVQA